MAKIKTAVIFGGTAQEHELSLASAAEVIRNIPTDKYEVICIGITKKGRWLYYPGGVEEITDGNWYLDPDCASAIISPDPIHHGIVTIENGEATVRRIDVAFPVMMGKKGADGTIQALLDMAGIPYVGCGHLSAASCMDKSHIHMLLDDYGIKTAEWAIITQRDINNIDKRCDEIAETLGFPVVVKPAKSGCSIGTTIAEDMKKLIAAVKIAFSNDNKVVVEKYVKSRKLEVAVFGYDAPFASFVGEISSCKEFYDFDAKYVLDGSQLSIPAELTLEKGREIQAEALRAYKAMGCKGLSRVDFFLKEDGEIIVNEINTMPGFT
ncbi:MAG: D-alanine--D-alanine ligase, partial [Oscillospiraceae bacterium]|nr:D-alanine--D-alanine ligase [Oscillospiraceae bacterium]